MRNIAIPLFILIAACSDPAPKKSKHRPKLTLNEIIFITSEKYDVKPHLIKSIIHAESEFNKNAKRYERKLRIQKSKNTILYNRWIPSEYKKNKLSYSSIGYMQVLYGTARNMGYRGSPEGLFNPRINIDIGTRYLRDKIKQYKYQGQYISAYNAGRPIFSTNINTMFKNQKYVNNVYKNYIIYKPHFKIHYFIRDSKIPKSRP